MIESITKWDLSVLVYIRDHLRCSFLDPIMWVITHLAEPFMCPIYPVIFILIGSIIYYKRHKSGRLGEEFRPKFDFAKMGWMMGVALLLGLLVCNITIKPLIARDRPYLFEELRIIEEQSDKSFPSGHTVAVFEMAFAVSYYCIKKKKKVWALVAYALALLIAYSRLYVGVHYPTDVFAGMIIGTVCGILGVVIVNAVYKKFFDKKIYGE